MDKHIKLELSEYSIENAIQELTKIAIMLDTKIHDEIIDKVAIEVQENANRNLMQSGLKFYGFTNITKSWRLEKMSVLSVGSIGISATPIQGSTIARLVNYDEFSPYVEFGTGMVGKSLQHKMAKKSGYKYNIDTPYKKNGKWTFKIPNTDEFIYNFSGYVGKAFLYNASYDIHNNIYNQGRIVQPILDKYIK